MRSEATEPRGPWIWISPSGLTSLGNITLVVKGGEGEEKENGESGNQRREERTDFLSAKEGRR